MAEQSPPGQLGLTKERRIDDTTRRSRSSSCTAACPTPEQQKIIERFALATPWSASCSPPTSLSEGVNMHRQCHHLIHYDLPWSLIRIEQRNGRIDRYGQVHQPQFAALVLTSPSDGAKDDTTVAEKLLSREETAHSQLGTAEGVTRQFTSAKKEEDRLVKDLLAGKTVEQSIDELAGTDPGLDFLADLLGGVGDQPDNDRRNAPTVPRLFASTEQFARAALTSAASGLHVDDDGELLAFAPPDDLIQRLSVLPPSYLTPAQGRRADEGDLQQAARAAQARRGPRDQDAVAGDRLPLRPAPDDRLADRQGAAPRPPPAGPGADRQGHEPAFLIQGVYSNALGQPTVVEWMAVTGLPGSPRVGDMTERSAPGRRRPPHGQHPPVRRHRRSRSWCPQPSRRPATHLEARRAEYDAKVNGPIEEYRARLATWEQLSLDVLPASSAASASRSGDGRGTAPLTDALRTAGEPLLRVLAVLSPDAGRAPDELRLHHQPRRLPLPALPGRGAAPRPGEEEQPPHPLGRTRQGGQPTPVKGLRALRREYFDARLSLKEPRQTTSRRARRK